MRDLHVHAADGVCRKSRRFVRDCWGVRDDLGQDRDGDLMCTARADINTYGIADSREPPWLSTGLREHAAHGRRTLATGHKTDEAEWCLRD